MKQVFFLLSFFFIFCFFSCTRDNRNSETDTAVSIEGTKESDSTIYSMPLPYTTIKDTISESSKLEIRSYKDMLELFEKLNYTPEAWQAGIREVPRLYLTLIGPRWGSTTTKEIEVLQKKQIFFRGLAPLILKSNELILKDRTRLEEIRLFHSEGKEIGENDHKWTLKLAKVYRVNHNDGQLSEDMIQELWEKVDIVPPSLALSQGAEESGWGTSRFAALGNAIYGQWTWGENAIVPEQQRKELGNYGIAAFESLQESVSGYMLNLNTHNAYSDLRKKRAELRKNGEKISGSLLAEQLINYSERGEEYVKTLKSLMEYNRLGPADDAYLSNAPPVFLIPAE
jgi:uncharacterized FlgJ-related protein